MTQLPKRLWTGCEPYKFNDGFPDFSQTDTKWENVFAENTDEGTTTVEINDVNAVFANCTSWMTMLDLGYYPGSVSTGKTFASECGGVLFWWQQSGKSGEAKGKAFWPYRVFVSRRRNGADGPNYSERTDFRAAAVAEKTGWSVDSVVPADYSSLLFRQDYFMTEGSCDSSTAPGNGWCSAKITLTAYDGEPTNGENPDPTHVSSNVEIWAKISPAGGEDDLGTDSEESESIDEGKGFKILLFSEGREKCFQFPVAKGDRITIYSNYVGEEEFGFETIDIAVNFRGTVI